MNKKELKWLKRHLNMKDTLDQVIFEKVKNRELSVSYVPIS